MGIEDVVRALNKVYGEERYVLFSDGYRGICIARVHENSVEPITAWKADRYELMDWLEGVWEEFERRRSRR